MDGLGFLSLNYFKSKHLRKGLALRAKTFTSLVVTVFLLLFLISGCQGQTVATTAAQVTAAQTTAAAVTTAAETTAAATTAAETTPTTEGPKTIIYNLYATDGYYNMADGTTGLYLWFCGRPPG